MEALFFIYVFISVIAFIGGAICAVVNYSELNNYYRESMKDNHKHYMRMFAWLSISGATLLWMPYVLYIMFRLARKVDDNG